MKSEQTMRKHYFYLLILFYILPLSAQETKSVAPVYLAAKQGRLETLRELIAAGADVNAANAQGRTALMTAVYLRNEKIIRELLVEGANINAVDAQGKTALMLAVQANNLKITQQLVVAGADLTLKDKQENTAQTLAEKIENKKLIELVTAK